MVAAKRDLPKGYMTALWGKIVPAAYMKKEDEEWGFETPEQDFINPVKYPGSQTQFCQCPGPNECVTVGWTPNPSLFMTDDATEKLNKISSLFKKINIKTGAKKEKGFVKYAKNDNVVLSKKTQEEVNKLQKSMDAEWKQFQNFDFEDGHGCFTFQTTKDIPKNHQLVMMYAESEKSANEFFEVRGLTRCDVYTSKYPTILKKSADVKNLLLQPKSSSSSSSDKPIKTINKKVIKNDGKKNLMNNASSKLKK